ncbi:hypothetical protein CDAR_612221 [Caerostris darwini]|uniref:Uncharacterized protein n=1 Tax=Caerostris darwini TaxID=1538125 RepID=A0AAV4RYH8_9ARAC|nr:hypothetical protein CDAR_612221 [Caerostris darwini]
MRFFRLHNNLLQECIFSHRAVDTNLSPSQQWSPRSLRRKPPAPFSRPNGNQERAAPFTAAQGAHRGVTVFIYDPPTTEKGKSPLNPHSPPFLFLLNLSSGVFGALLFPNPSLPLNKLRQFYALGFSYINGGYIS